MKKLMVLSVIVAGMVLMAGFSSSTKAQSPANDPKPTFISPTPGLYVNGWPAFTVSYPKEWVEMPPPPNAVLQVGVSRPDLPPSPRLNILVYVSAFPLEDWAKVFMPVWVEYSTDIKVLSDKPVQLKDGTPAREVETEWVRKNGIKENGLLLMTKKEFTCVAILLAADKGKLGEDVKNYVYSLTFLRGREEPVNVPPDVRAFLDMYCVDVVSHDIKTIMEHFSDRLLWSGGGKASVEHYFRNDPTSPIHQDVISEEAIVTVFEPHGDKAYLDGFYLEKIKGEVNSRKMPMYGQQIINEHGEWKFFGNQK